MKILCPLSPASAGGVEQLAARGAHEFYMGYTSDFSNSSLVLSRRPGTKNNFSSLDAMAPVVEQIKSLGLKSNLAVNSVFYPRRYMDKILDDMDRAVEIGIDGFIMADFNLFLGFRKRHPESYVSASTCMHTLNSGYAGFLGDLGYSRVILSRHLAVGEMRKIISSRPELEFEVFVKNDECPNVDGLCSYYHGVLKDKTLHERSDQADTACKFIFTPDKRVTGMLKMNYDACGVCDLFELRGLTNLSLKISGRNLPLEQLVSDVGFVSAAAGLLREAASREEYEAGCRDFHSRIYGKECDNSCYRKSMGANE